VLRSLEHDQCINKACSSLVLQITAFIEGSNNQQSILSMILPSVICLRSEKGAKTEGVNMDRFVIILIFSIIATDPSIPTFKTTMCLTTAHPAKTFCFGGYSVTSAGSFARLHAGPWNYSCPCLLVLISILSLRLRKCEGVLAFSSVAKSATITWHVPTIPSLCVQETCRKWRGEGRLQ